MKWIAPALLLAGALGLLLWIFGYSKPAVEPVTVFNSPFVYSFSGNDTLYEAGSANESTSPYWWLNSGGALLLHEGYGSTYEERLPAENRWRTRYAKANPTDTDSGEHPQNLFRLVSRSAWRNPVLEASFFIKRDNISESSNRDASNGLLLMSRYSPDGQTLYYAGIRVDGTAVIKKKYHGTYYTMAQQPIFPGMYDREHTPNLLPHQEWIGLRTETISTAAGTTITLYIRLKVEEPWEAILVAVDTGKEYEATPVIEGPGAVGIRTDFMDVEFREVLIREEEW